MTGVKTIAKFFEAFCQAFKKPLSFKFGTYGQRDIDVFQGNDAYPLVYLEEPFYTQAQLMNSIDTAFTVLILGQPNVNDNTDELAVLDSLQVNVIQPLEAFIWEYTQRNPVAKNWRLYYDYSGVSLTKFGRDNACGWRLEFKLQTAPDAPSGCDTFETYFRSDLTPPDLC